MESACLFVLIFCSRILTFVLAGTQQSTVAEDEKPDELAVPSKTVQVLPYILQKKNDASAEKQYTLLTAATGETIPNSRVHFKNAYVNDIKSHETLADKTEKEKIIGEENALPKVDTFGNWQHTPHFLYDPNDHNAITHAYKHYYANAAQASSLGYGASFPAGPTPLFLLLNLGMLSYVLLGVLGLLNKVVGTVPNGLGAYSTISHNAYDSLGHHPFNSLWKIAKDIQGE